MSRRRRVVTRRASVGSAPTADDPLRPSPKSLGGFFNAISRRELFRTWRGEVRGDRARHPHQHSRTGLLKAAMFWPSSSSAAKGTFRYARVPAFALGCSPSPRWISRPLVAPAIRAFSWPLRGFSRVVRRHGTRPPGNTTPRRRTRGGLLFPIPTRVPFADFSVSPHRAVVFVSPLASLSFPTRKPARRRTTPPARARLCDSTSTRRSVQGTCAKRFCSRPART